MTELPQTEDFKEGDQVYLKSGSSRLTVTKVEGNIVEVIWAPYKGTTIEKAVVPAVALRKAYPK